MNRYLSLHRRHSGRSGSRRWRTVLLVTGVVLAAVAWMVPTVLPASASLVYISTPTRVQAAGDVNFYPAQQPGNADPEWLIVATSLTLRAGETRRLIDRLTATISSGEGAEFDNIIVCVDASTGEQAAVAHTTGTNHPGSSAGQIALTGTLLFTAPQAGTYSCRVRASTSDGSRHNYSMTAVRGTWPSGTWLEVSSADEVGAHMWDALPCGSPGVDLTCQYLGGSGEPTAFNLFQDRQARYVWTAAPGATTADVAASTAITTCTRDGSSCTVQHRGSSNQSRLRSHVELVQLLPSGQDCVVNRGQDIEYVVTKSVHHLPINYRLNVPIRSNCQGSRQFVLRVVMNWVSGNPVKIDGGTPNGYKSTSHATVINSVIATTATVPAVVNVDETTATDAIGRAGLVVGAVTRVNDASRAGAVIMTNPPATSVVPSGSVVDVQVSLGPFVPPADQALVPDVTGMSRPAAVTAIQNAGFVATVTGIIDCSKPGKIFDQNPGGGSYAPPGSTVQLWQDIGNSTTCGF